MSQLKYFQLPTMSISEMGPILRMLRLTSTLVGPPVNIKTEMTTYVTCPCGEFDRQSTAIVDCKVIELTKYVRTVVNTVWLDRPQSNDVQENMTVSKDNVAPSILYAFSKCIDRANENNEYIVDLFFG